MSVRPSLVPLNFTTMKGVLRLIRIGNIFGATGGSFAGNIHSPDGLCPTINTSGGGYREPMIIETYEQDNRGGATQ